MNAAPHSPAYYLALALVYLPITATAVVFGWGLYRKAKRLFKGRNAYRLTRRQRFTLPG